MKRLLLSCVAALATAGGVPGVSSAAGITICNDTHMMVGFAVGYVHAKSLEFAGPFESDAGKCATFLTEVAEGPFYPHSPDDAVICCASVAI